MSTLAQLNLSRNCASLRCLSMLLLLLLLPSSGPQSYSSSVPLEISHKLYAPPLPKSDLYLVHLCTVWSGLSTISYSQARLQFQHFHFHLTLVARLVAHFPLLSPVRLSCCVFNLQIDMLKILHSLFLIPLWPAQCHILKLIV